MNKQDIINYVDNKYRKKNHKEFRVGDTIRVHVKIKEGNTTRVQVFEGVVIAFKGQGEGRTFTARKLSFGVGVERVFPLYSPTIEKIQVVRSGHTRRSKLYYLRSRVGKAARLEEKERAESTATPKSSSAKSKAASKPQPELVATDKK